MTRPLLVSAWINISVDSLTKQLQKERGAFSFSIDWSDERTGPVDSLQPIRLTPDGHLTTAMTTVTGGEFTSRDVIFYTLDDWAPQPSELTVRCDLVASRVLDYLQKFLTVLLSFKPAVVSRLEYFPGFYPEELPPEVQARYSTWQAWIATCGGQLAELSKRYRPAVDEDTRLRELWANYDITIPDIARILAYSPFQLTRKAHRLRLPPRPRGRKKGQKNIKR